MNIRFITRLRRASEAGWAPETQTSPSTRPQGPSARAVSCTWVCPAGKRSQEAQLSVDQRRQVDPSIGQAYTLSQACLALVRERQGDALEAWMAKAAASRIEALARLAQGLQEDLAAVQAGRTLPWSNGPVAGHVNRLKLLKRQGYGRADVALLRQRVLQVVEALQWQAALPRVPHVLIGYGGWGHVAQDNQGGMPVEAAITPLPAQGSVPVRGFNPGSPKARKIQDVLARFGEIIPQMAQVRNCDKTV